jgi:hypothetical protein
MALIQCLLGAASPVLSSQTYTFERDKHGRFVAEVFDLVHIQCLLSRDDIYREVKAEPEKPIEAHIETLLGSSVLPSMVEIGPNIYVQLGDVVARAHTESGLTLADWNAMANDEREALLAATVDAMKAENAPAQPEPEPEPEPEPGPEAAAEPETPDVPGLADESRPEADGEDEPETTPEEQPATDSVVSSIVTEAVVKPATAPRRGRRRG